MNGVREYVGYGDASASRNTFLYVHMYRQLLDVSNSLPEQLIMKIIYAMRNIGQHVKEIKHKKIHIYSQ